MLSVLPCIFCGASGGCTCSSHKYQATGNRLLLARALLPEHTGYPPQPRSGDLIPESRLPAKLRKIAWFGVLGRTNSGWKLVRWARADCFRHHRCDTGPPQTCCCIWIANISKPEADDCFRCTGLGHCPALYAGTHQGA